ncbi:MAG TPA: hypothetical protein VMA37_12840 [Acetobacteraceae bacterium]|nr:hypothetical protein [Acetobacteraceae bacterium]
MAKIVNTPLEKCPFRLIIDSANDSAVASYAAIDRVHEKFLRRPGFGGFLLLAMAQV